MAPPNACNEVLPRCHGWLHYRDRSRLKPSSPLVVLPFSPDGASCSVDRVSCFGGLQDRREIGRAHWLPVADRNAQCSIVFFKASHGPTQNDSNRGNPGTIAPADARLDDDHR
jgi:hypothetical protein